jgi:hypothetical protein
VSNVSAAVAWPSRAWTVFTDSPCRIKSEAKKWRKSCITVPSGAPDLATTGRHFWEKSVRRRGAPPPVKTKPSDPAGNFAATWLGAFRPPDLAKSTENEY